MINLQCHCEEASKADAAVKKLDCFATMLAMTKKKY